MKNRNIRKNMKNICLHTVLSNAICYLPLLGVMLLAAALPFQYGWVQRSALYLFCISYVTDYVLNKRWNGWHWTRDKWVFAVMILFFLVTPLRQLFDATSPTAYFRGQVEMRTAFLAVGIVGLMGWNNKIDVCRYAGYTMLAVAVGIVVYVGLLEWTGAEVPDGGNRYLYNALLHRYVGAHMRVDFYQNMAIIMGFYLLYKNKSKWQVGVIVVAIVVLSVRMLFSDGRSGMLAMLLIVGSSALLYLYRSASTWGIVVSVMLLVLLGGVAIYQNERMSQSALHSEPRLAIWDYTLREIEKHPLCGYGLSSASKEFVANARQDESMQHYLNFVSRHPSLSKQDTQSMAVVNPHNLYLQLMLESGFLAPLLFVLMGALAVACCDRRKRFFMALTVFLILWQAVFDSFSPHFPPLLLCLCIWLMLLPEIRRKSENTSVGY